MIILALCRRAGSVRSVCGHRVLKRSYYKKVSNLKVKLLEDVIKIRNIGIIAHIDAGKTTTTERMLYYSGFSRAMGEVHDGDTVMDYMEQERERGITITSAAITFNWLKHQINLIDTPGHVDFTVEVERSLRVLDGAVAILDASAGVEAQTITVWTQANRYNVPRIVYLNKMDKPKANINLSLNGLKSKLNAVPLCLHMPLSSKGHFDGVVDLLTMEAVSWPVGDKDGTEFRIQKLSPECGDLWTQASSNREKLVEDIADLDNGIAEQLILNENASNVAADDLKMALRRLTLNHLAVPVLCGSSYRNVGVQLLMDAVINYLPSPDERQHSFILYYKGQLCALVFKIAYDKIRGSVTYLRLYSGTLKEGQTVYNATQNKTEKIGRIMLAFADELKDVASISQGQIAVVSGLTEVTTGDTLVTNSSAFEAAQRALKKDDKEPSAFLAGIQVSEPVFFCSIEAPSLSTQAALDKALINLQREDPSLKVSANPDSGQIIIAGMGELHIDIVKDRILKEHGVEAYLGPLQISYRESLTSETTITHVLDKSLSGVKHYVEITLEAIPEPGPKKDIQVVVTKENELHRLRTDHFKYIKNGCDLAFSYGPILGCPVVDVKLKLHAFQTTSKTSPAMISAAASQCVNQLLRSGGAILLEPIMKMEIVCESKYRDKVLQDLQRRRSQDLSVEDRQDMCVIFAKTPLTELRRYSSILRTFTSGTAAFSMEFDSYLIMDQVEQSKAIQSVTGFAPAY